MNHKNCFSDLLSELCELEQKRFYLWLSQRIHHVIMAGQVQGDLRSPRWTPISIFYPAKAVKALSPGIYFMLDSTVDVTAGASLKYVFQPVLDYVCCILTGCPGMCFSFRNFMDTWVPGSQRHQSHPPSSDSDKWISVKGDMSTSLFPFEVDAVCRKGNCRWCLMHGLHE